MRSSQNEELQDYNSQKGVGKMYHFIQKMLLLLAVFSFAQIAWSQQLQTGLRARVYLKRMLPEFTSQLAWDAEVDQWLIKPKTIIQSYDGDSLRILLQISAIKSQRNWDSAKGKWEYDKINAGTMEYAIHRQEIAKVEILQKTVSNWGKGALVGSILGGGIDGIIGSLIEMDWFGGIGEGANSEPIRLTAPCAVLGLATGFFIGAGVGASHKTDVWRDVFAESR